MKIEKLLFIVSAFLLAGCAGAPELKKHTFTIELGQDVYANPALYVKDEQAPAGYEVVATTTGISKKDNRFITRGYDFLVVGEYEFALQKGSESIPFGIKIKDTRPPTVTQDVQEIQAALGETIDWKNYFQATDLSGVSYEAPLDTTATPGDHDISVKISDRFGNTVEKPVKVVVS